MKVILISAHAQNGKDTTANIIYEKLTKQGKKVLITHFADLLKYICKTFFGWDGNKDDVGRGILQRVGTNVVREKDPDYWVRFVKSILSLFPDEWDYVLIPDCRFPNEADGFNDYDHINLRITRTDFKSPLTEEQQNHPSETALDNYSFDYYMNTKSGLDSVRLEVDKFLVWMNERDGETT
jgi:hypothetical protein